MTTDPQPDPAQANQQLRIENSLLRASLFLTARALKDYHDSKHVKTEQEGMVQLTVPESLRARAADALTRANRMLKEQEKGIRI